MLEEKKCQTELFEPFGLMNNFPKSLQMNSLQNNVQINESDGNMQNSCSQNSIEMKKSQKSIQIKSSRNKQIINKDEALEKENENVNNASCMNEKRLQKLVLQYQSESEDGYYSLQNWRELHCELFGAEESLLTEVILNGWRMLKLINFGDDFVPNGLIFDMLATIFATEQSSEECEAQIKRIFYKFFEFNNNFLTQKEKEGLVFFRVLRSIVEGYRQVILGSFSPTRPKQDASIQRSLQLHRLHNVISYKKNLQSLKQISAQFQECTFKPLINVSSEGVSSRYLSMPRCNTQPTNQEEVEENNERLFHANPMPEYPSSQPNGLQEYLSRMEKSRQIQQINAFRPFRLGAQQELTQFNLSFKGRRPACPQRILFLINVEVGKHIYRIKVRQHMTVDEVVANIQKMVGFREPSLLSIVHQYFLNYQKRMLKKVKCLPSHSPSHSHISLFNDKK